MGECLRLPFTGEELETIGIETPVDVLSASDATFLFPFLDAHGSHLRRVACCARAELLLRWVDVPDERHVRAVSFALKAGGFTCVKGTADEMAELILRKLGLTLPVFEMIAHSCTIDLGSACHVSSWPVRAMNEQNAAILAARSSLVLDAAAFDTAINAEKNGLSDFASAVMQKFTESDAKALASRVPADHAQFVACSPDNWSFPAYDERTLRAKAARNEAGYRSLNARRRTLAQSRAHTYV